LFINIKGEIMIATLLALSVLTAQPISTETPVTTTSSSQQYQEDLYQIEITPGNGTVSVVWSDRLRSVWGSSYAKSTEYVELYYSGGVWRSGVEVSTTTWDVINWNAPKTIFNISTVRIPPNTIP
jgi:hypothetical protein